ncbi:nuclear transport factor 2 family protein [Portibacter marinus]|uniref:nuclear transport factor 2 family protein n=1 Tax=Portibacter marinus TaxID=2898660 RepID=UPI001F398B17|nr:nuclear transport factor 2 family protein [Portibacter marinus]
MKRVLVIAVYLMLTLMVSAQEENNHEIERQAIESVIVQYFDGWLTGDTTLVGSAMHSTCNLKFVRDGEIVRRDRENYLSGFKPRPRLPNAEGRILAIDITRTAASAKVELETASRLFTDYFNLLKEDDRWYITDKVSTSISKE